MTTEAVKDSLGHPCQFTQARQRFAEPFGEARKLDRNAIKRQIGLLLNELDKRTTNSACVLNVMSDIKSENEDLQALLAMAIDYDIQTSDRYWKLAGLVLASFDQWESANVEVPHG